MNEKYFSRNQWLLIIGDSITLFVVTLVGFSSHQTLTTAGTRIFSTFIPWTISWVGANNSNNILDNNEKAEITGWILDRDNAIAVGTNDSIAYMDGSGDGGGAGGMTSSETVLSTGDQFTIEVLTQGGAVIAIERRLPDAFKNVMDLK